VKREPPRPPQAILFDLYGTLVPNFPPETYLAAVAAMADELGVQPEEFRKIWHARFISRATGKDGGVISSIQRALKDIRATADDECLERARERRLEFARSLYDAGEKSLAVLHALKARGIPLALVSDCSREVMELWDSHPLFAPFAARSLSCELGAMKPEPERYLHALRALGAEARSSWYVGDGGSREFTGARAVGLFTILHRQPGSRQFVHDEDGTKADMEVAELAELIKMLDGD
jgi:putative hydrolase of the HAD superfamily